MRRSARAIGSADADGDDRLRDDAAASVVTEVLASSLGDANRVLADLAGARSDGAAVLRID